MLEVEQMIRFLEISLKLLEYYLLFSTSMDQTFSIEFGGNFTKYVATKKSPLMDVSLFPMKLKLPMRSLL